MPRAVCPGSFDPVTNGHLDIIGRAASLFDEVVVGVLVNESKQSLFGVDERVAMITEALGDLDNVQVTSFGGLLVDFCTANDVRAIVKGLRRAGDFDYELQMAQMNHRLADVDTVFLAASPERAFVASSLVKEVARHGGDVSGLVPPHVLDALRTRFGH